MGGGGDNAPTTYNPGWQKGADQQFQQLAQSTGSWASAIPSTVAPYYGATLGNIINNPNAASAMSTADRVSGLGQGVGGADLTNAGLMTGAGNAGLSAALAALQAGFDPQGALYNRTQQQVSDQANATAAMYGLGSSPYGAGTTGQTLSNFNIDWQNNQLGRELAALSGFTGGAAGAANDFGAAASLGQNGLGVLTNSGMLPYETSQGIYGNDLNALGAYTSGMVGALTPGFQQQNSDLGYIAAGQNASAQNLSAWEQQQKANQSMWGGIMNLFGGNNLGSSFGGGGGGGGFMSNLGSIFGGGGGAGGAGSMAGASDLMDLMAFA